jgi:hypothetical protein
MASAAAAGAATDEGDDMGMKAAPLLGLVLVLGVTGGCGSGGDDGAEVASAGKPTTSAGASASRGTGSEKDGLLRYAQCMRDNGIADFPDPDFQSDGGVSLNMPAGTDPKLVDAAQQKCKTLLPNGGEDAKVDPKVTEQLRKYSKCMRDNGITNFPDPSPGGGLKINNDQLGISTDDPKYKAAVETCSQYLPKPPGGGESNQTHGAGAGA